MAYRTRSKLALFTALTTLILATLSFGLSGSASATTYGYTDPVMNKKILRLHTTNVAGDTDRFYINGSTGPSDAVGSGTGNNKCKLRFDGAAPADPAKVTGDLVTVQARGRNPSTGEQAAAPNGWYVGFSNTDNSIGVGSESSNNTKCSQINEVSPTSEVLTVELQNGTGSTYKGWYWDALELDLEAKFRPQHVYYELLNNGTPVSGQEKVNLPICTDPSADCGPDSSDLDNWRVAIPQPSPEGVYPSVLFDEVRIWPETQGTVGNGSIDLKGGSDGTKPFCFSSVTPCPDSDYGLAKEASPDAPASVTDSLFRLVLPAEGQICDGQTISEPTQTGQATVTFPEDPNATICKPYLLTYTRDPATNDRNLEFLTAGQNVQVKFEVKITAWDPEKAVLPVPPTKVEPPLPLHNGQWCLGTGPNWQMPPTVDPNDPPTAVESWCLISQTSENYGPDGDGSSQDPNNPNFDWVPNYDGQLMKVTETWQLEGDASGHR